MADLQNFDARTVEPAMGFEPLPAARYVAVITASEMKPTKNGNGRFLEMTFQVIDGECKGRNVWARLNLENPSPEAVRIARAELSAICRAVGVLVPKDSVELHNLPLVIRVKLKKRQDTGEMTNVIAGYEKRETATGQPKQAAGDAPPWARR